MSELEERIGLEGSVAVMFGGGGGLGRACAYELGAAGVHLHLNDRDTALLDETRDTLRRRGATVTTSVFDGRDPEAQARFFDEVDEADGGLDILVNVIGGTFPQPFEENVPKGWDALMRTNFTWLLSAIQLAIPRMQARGGGSIINLTSIEGHRAAPGHAVYAAMKAAVESLTRTLAVELGPDGIRVNTIAPDFVPTEGLRAIAGSGDGDGHREGRAAALTDAITVPLGRQGTYEDVGGCALFLASKLSSFVTGTTLHPDGGVHAAGGWFRWPDVGWRPSVPPRAVQSYLDGGD
jgi:3-oxoacyl-[acyl-carrier protein] reductase